MAEKYSAFAKLYITTEKDADNLGHDAVLGNGMAALLRGIEEQGSLNKAAKEMHMAYSKAWKLLNKAEEYFDTALVMRDGAHGSSLTPEGQLLLHAFDAVTRDINDYAVTRLQEEVARIRTAQDGKDESETAR